MKEIKIILASASPRRKEILKQIGFEPVIIPSDIQEDITKTEPDQVVMELSLQKAAAVAASLKKQLEYSGQEPVVIGSDTVVFSEGRILGKPADEEEADRMLTLLQGNSHQVFTGVTLIKGERKRTFYEKTEVFVYPMTKEERRGYIRSGDPMDKAGAYGIQGLFAAYIKGIRGSYTNVMGLPAGRVYQELKQLMEEQDD